MWSVFIPTLNTPPCFAGYCDWRMPTVAELVAATGEGLLTNPAGGYWTSESDADPVRGRAVQAGTPYTDPKAFNLFVRAVRSLP